MDNPWKLKSSKEVYNNPWIQVEHHEVTDPSGNPGIYGKVHFKNFAIGIIPIDEEGNTWLVGQYRYPLDIYSWEIPMGGGLRSVSILESAKRELEEETGIQARSWDKIITLHPSNSVCDEVGIVYIAEGLTFGPTKFESTEDLQIQKLPFKTVYEKVIIGEITDAISVAGVLKTGVLRPELIGK